MYVFVQLRNAICISVRKWNYYYHKDNENVTITYTSLCHTTGQWRKDFEDVPIDKNNIKCSFARLIVSESFDRAVNIKSAVVINETGRCDSNNNTLASCQIRKIRGVVGVGWGVPNIPGPCATGNFTYLARGPLWFYSMLLHSTLLH